MSELQKKSSAVAQAVKDGYRKIESGVVGGYKKVEEGTVNGYKKMESGIVNGFNKVSDKIVVAVFAEQGESVEDAKKRLSGKTKKD